MTPSPPRQRVRSTPTARRVRSRQLLVDSPAIVAVMFREGADSPLPVGQEMQTRASPVGRDVRRTPASAGAWAAGAGTAGWAAYKVMPEAYYGRVSERRDAAADSCEHAEVCGDALRGLRYMEDGLKSLQAMQDAGRSHALAFADLDRVNDDAVTERNRTRRAAAESLASRAMGYLTWLDMFETEVYDRLAPIADTTRRTLAALQRGSAYDDSLSFLALVSDLTYAREILRRECVALVFLPGMWDLRAELDRKRSATQAGLGELQSEVAKCLQKGLASLDLPARQPAGADETVVPAVTSQPTVTPLRLAEAVQAMRRIALPAMERDLAAVTSTVVEASSISLHLARPAEVASFDCQEASSGGQAGTTRIGQAMLQPLRERLDELDLVLQWLETAKLGWQQAIKRLQAIEESHTAEAVLTQAINALAATQTQDADTVLASLREQYTVLSSSQSFDRINLIEPPARSFASSWLDSVARKTRDIHSRTLASLDERSISLARKLPRHTTSLAWLSDVVSKRGELEAHDATLLQILDALVDDSLLVHSDLERMQTVVDMVARQIPILTLELRQMRRRDPRTGLVAEHDAKPDQPLIARTTERLHSAMALLAASRTALERRQAEGEGDQAFSQVTAVILAFFCDVNDAEESLLTLLDIVKWHLGVTSTAFPTHVKSDVQILQARWENQTNRAMRSLKQQFPERAEQLANVDGQSQRLERMLVQLLALAQAVEEVHYQREYVLEVFSTASALQAGLLSPKDKVDSRTTAENSLNTLEKQIGRTPLVSRRHGIREDAGQDLGQTWNDREALGRRAAELSSLTPPSSPRPQRTHDRERGSVSLAAGDTSRIQAALDTLPELDARVRRALNELFARLQVDMASACSVPSQQGAKQRDNKHSLSRSVSVASQESHSTSLDSFDTGVAQSRASKSTSRHSLYDETASTRARRISTLADRTGKQADTAQTHARPRSRVISETGVDVLRHNRRRPSSMLSTSSSMQSLRSAATEIDEARPDVEVASTPMPRLESSERQSLGQSRRSVTRTTSNGQMRQAGAAAPSEVKAHPRLDAAIRKTVQVHKQEHLDIVPASPARTDKDCIEGAYTFRYGDKSATRFCRIMVESDKVWVRVGGGFESLDEFLNRTFSAFIHQALAEPVSSETSHATLMGFESPEAMSRILHAHSSPEGTPAPRGAASPVRHLEGTPLAHKARVNFTAGKRTGSPSQPSNEHGSPPRERSGSASPVTMRTNASGSPSIVRRFSVTSASSSSLARHSSVKNQETTTLREEDTPRP